MNYLAAARAVIFHRRPEVRVREGWVFMQSVRTRYLMTRLFRLAVALLVALLAVGFLTAPALTSAVDGSNSNSLQDQAEQDQPSYASHDAADVSGEGYQSVSINIGAAVQAEAQTLRTEHDRRVFDAALRRASSDAAQQFAAEQRLQEIESRYERLDQREAELITTYGDGTIAEQLFLSELAILQTALEGQSSLQAQASTVVPASDRLLNYEETLLANAPITERIVAAQRSVEDNPTIYVQTGQDAVVLATIEDQPGSGGTFVRQATIRDARDLTAGSDAETATAPAPDDG